MNKANGRFPSRYPLELLNGCVAHYDMQDMGNKIIDHSGRENHGTAIGTTPIAKPYGYTRSFDGVDDYIQTGNITSSGQMMIDLWFYPKTGAGNRLIWGTGSDKAILTVENNLTMAWYMNIGGVATGYQFSVLTYVMNRWNHAALVYDGSNIRFYINGVLDVVSFAITGVTQGNGGLNFGTNSTATGSWFNGFMDDVRVWNIARSASEIKQQFQEDAWKYGIAY